MVFLLSPDMKILKNKTDLNLYIAKNAAIVDTNVINFSLPKKTALVRDGKPDFLILTILIISFLIRWSLSFRR